MPAKSAGRAGRAWRQACARVYREEHSCWLCGEPVDQTLESTHPMSRSADHLVQLQHGGHPTLRTNLRLCHLRCNSARSARMQGLRLEGCACSVGRPCAPLSPMARRGMVQMDTREV